MLAGWIITGVIAVPFTILAIVLLNGKGAFLIAGFNTMSEEKRATYDEKALCRAVGWLLITITVIMFLFPLAISLQQMWLFWVSFIFVFALTIGFAIYANTGNRFRKSLTPGEQTPTGEKKPMSRGKKVAIVIGIVFSVQICIGIGIMIYQGERDPRVYIHPESIQIGAMYGLTIDKTDIDEVVLIEKSMGEIGIGTRTNGYDSGGQALKGNFLSAEHGHQLLFVYAGSSPTIQITGAQGLNIFISYRDSETTRNTYRLLSFTVTGE